MIKSVGIAGIGYSVPEKIVTNADLEKIVDTSDEWIVERTGIRERRIAAEGVSTSTLAAEAAMKALADAKLTPEDIDLIIVGSASPDMLFPSTACLVQAKIGAKNAGAFDLSAACSSFVYAMSVGSQMIATGIYKHVLVIGAEVLSKIMDWQDRNTCVLFGDGAGAAVLSEVEPGYGILGIDLGADGTGADALLVPAGGTRMPATEATIAGRQHFVHMNGPEVFRFATKVMGASASRAMAHAGVSSDEIDWLIPHQANTRIIHSAAKRLNVPMEKVIVNVDRYGNTSSASIPIALAEARDQGKIKKGDTLVLVGFGGGLTWAGCVLKWSKEE